MNRHLKKLSILAPALALLLVLGLLGPPTGAATPASLVDPTAFEFVVLAGHTASDTLNVNNLGASPLDWTLALETGGTEAVGDWIFYYDWGCDGLLGSAAVTLNPDLTVVAPGATGTWTLTGSEVVMTFGGGSSEYAGYIAGHVMAGTMFNSSSTGCWEAERVIAGPVSLLSGERTLSGAPAADPGATRVYEVPGASPVQRVTLDAPTESVSGSGPDATTRPDVTSGPDVASGRQVANAPHQDLIPQALAATGGSVLWDLTHGVYLSYHPGGYYSSLTALLNSAGYTVDTTAAGVNNVDLFNYDLLVVNLGSNWDSVYTAPEVVAIDAFVRGGGGLLIMCDNPPGTPNANVNPVAQAFGTTCGVATMNLPITDFASHPVFTGVSQVEFSGGGELAASSPSGLVAFDPDGKGGVALAEAAAGRVAVVGDFNLWSNSYLAEASNQRFAENVFLWLSASWLSATPRSGTVAGASSQAVTVEVDTNEYQAGEYGLLILHSNAPGEVLVAVPVSLEVRPNLVYLPLVLRGWQSGGPVARDDAYAATGNVGISVPAGDGVLDNDEDPGGALPLSVISFDATSTGGGDVQVSADGSLTYDPPPGFEGLDTFGYTMQNTDGSQASATVSLQVADMLWFVDNTAATAGDGRLNSPFQSLAAFEALNGNGGPGDPEAGDRIFLYEAGGGPYGGGVTLEDSQVLVGQGATVSLENITGITLPPFSNSLPATGGSRPSLVNTSGDGIILAANNNLRGLDLGTTSGTGIAGSSVGTFEVLEMAIHSSGGGIDVDGGTLAVALDSLTTSGAGPGIDLTNVSGSFTLSSGAIATSGATGLTLSSGSNLAHNITLASISSSGGTHGVLLDSTSGSLAVTGASTIDNTTAAALRFLNTSATISFGDVTVTNRHDTGILIDTATGPSVSFGSITIDNPNNAGGVGILVEDSSAAVTVASASIRDTTQTVAQIDGGGGAPGNDGDGDAILLKNNSGSFTLNGGTLQDLADHGVDTRYVSGDVTLSGVTIQDIGISSGNAAALHPDGFYGYNFSGSLLVENSDIRRFETLSGSRGVEFLNVDTDFAEIRVQNTAIANPGTSLAGDDAVLFYGHGAVNGSIVIRDQFPVGHGSHRSTFSGLSGLGIQVLIGNSSGSGTVSVDVQNVAFKDAVNPAGFGGVEFSALGTAALDVEVRDNGFRNLFNIDTLGAGIVHFAPFGSSSLMAVVDGNTIDGSNSLTAAQGRRGIMITTGDLAGEQLQALDVTINDNDIDATAHEALYLDVRGDALTTAGPGNVRITNNRIGVVTPVAQSGREGIEIRVRDGIGGNPTQAKTVNLLVQNNQVRNADNGATDETVDIDAEDGSTLNATVLQNTFASNGSADNEFETTSEDAGATVCLDLRQNTASQGGGSGNGTYLLANTAGTFSANIGAGGDANAGTVSTSGTIGSTASCTQPPAASADSAFLLAAATVQ